MSGLAQLIATFELERISKLILLNINEMENAHIPPFQPDFPVLLWGKAPLGLGKISSVLQRVYSDSHPLRILSKSGAIRNVDLGLLIASERDTEVSAIYIPPLEAGTSLSAFQEIVAHLRAPDGCPWDRKQTHQSLRQQRLLRLFQLKLKSRRRKVRSSHHQR